VRLEGLGQLKKFTSLGLDPAPNGREIEELGRIWKVLNVISYGLLKKKKKQEFISRPFTLAFDVHILHYFSTVSTTLETLAVAGHQFLYPCIIE
jgi:hypothetical protein